ncbi:MAG: hypothetical protein ACLP9L_30385 [Thermoguttaceae bacterium]
MARKEHLGILAEFADLVFEGMTIGVWTIGAPHEVAYRRVDHT